MKKNKRLIACLCIASMLLSGVSVSAANESDSSVEQAAEDIQTDQIQRRKQIRAHQKMELIRLKLHLGMRQLMIP